MIGHFDWKARKFIYQVSQHAIYTRCRFDIYIYYWYRAVNSFSGIIPSATNNVIYLPCYSDRVLTKWNDVVRRKTWWSFWKHGLLYKRMPNITQRINELVKKIDIDKKPIGGKNVICYNWKIKMSSGNDMLETTMVVFSRHCGGIFITFNELLQNWWFSI